MRIFDHVTLDRSLIEGFFTLLLAACVMCSAAALDRFGRAGAREVSRCDDRPIIKIPTPRVPFRDDGPHVAINRGDTP